ncbi:hypothetical protein T472_0206745 [Youngiibacter fragilis 232.1]|uniref:Uncharacterized protein n=1 Tax=Youngiibacter fragilis 232.1 TaxID=994573 RepID=V7I528_9CLOT|nr:hypothetical protein T472_0206745 [Youngiibacter fragilis 232.1]
MKRAMEPFGIALEMAGDVHSGKNDSGILAAEL